MEASGKPIPERRLGKFKLRVIAKAGAFQGVVLPDSGGVIGPFEGKDAEDVWRRLEEEAGKAGQGYVGFAGATARFLRFFPDGFADPSYAAQERDYKLAAKAKLDAAVPLADALAGHDGIAGKALSAFRATNLLPSFEKAKVSDLLRSPAADSFVHAAARFASGEGEPALLEMGRILRQHESGRWAVATYLPFLWRPDSHMFLKPDVTREFAVRVGHRFAYDYESQLSIQVYNSLMELVGRTEAELVGEGLHARDRIDVQSFIYVVGGYQEADAPRLSSEV